MIINTGSRTDIPAYFSTWFFNSKYSIEKHIYEFNKMSSKLSGYTDECVISFIDLYEKTKRNFKDVREVSKEERYIIIHVDMALCIATLIMIKGVF